MRTIDADELKKCKVYSEERHEYVVAVFNIDNAPTVEFEVAEKFYFDEGYKQGTSDARPTGEWINIKNRRGWLHLTCSCCSYNDLKCSISDIPKFCPNCGSYMRKEADNATDSES